jgi:hypothetical protein
LVRLPLRRFLDRFFAFFTLCCGGLFATTSTARSKRAHASGKNSTCFSDLFAMDLQAIEQAKTKLRKAEKALEALKDADGYELSEEAWSDFLLAASTIYSKLEQGSKSKGTSAGWFGRKKKERKDDALLRYLHHARNSDEHGIERVAERGGNQQDLLTGEKLKFNERREKLITEIYDPKTGERRMVNIRAYLYGPSLQMIRVHDRRFGDHCDPPTQHLGKPIDLEDNSLLGVATLGLTYLKRLVEEAESLV